ncbi:MAG: mechanosensitive ion channel family protein [Rickettsiales bacterium]
MTNEQLNTILSILPFDLSELGWTMQITIILLFTWLISLTLQLLMRRIPWKNVDSSFRLAVIASAAAPLRVIVWLAGLSVAFDVVKDHFKWEEFESVIAYTPVLYAIIFGWFLLRLKRHLFALYSRRVSSWDKSTFDVMEKIATAAIIVGSVLMVLPSLGISISGVLAFGGVGGIIIGLAAKDMLTNFFGAMMIHLDRPFAIGEWISLPEKNIEGIVEDIGWRQVVVRNFSRRKIFIPNAMFGTMVLENPSRMTHRKIDETIGVRYDDIPKVEAIINDVREFLLGHPEIDDNETLVVNLNSFGAYSVDFRVYTFTRRTSLDEYMKLKQEVLLKISDIITSHGAEIAFPTQIVNLHKAPSEPDKQAESAA